MNRVPVLTLLTLLPALGALVLALWRPARAAVARGVALAFSGAVLAGVVLLAAASPGGDAGPRWEERHRWIPSLGAEYHVGLDGLGLVALLLVALLVPFSILVHRGGGGRPAAYHAWILLLEAALLGAFTALGFLHWFLFWELALVPAFFLVQGWGGPGRRPAAIQFFVYTFVGSIAMLLAMLGVFLAAGTLDLVALGQMGRDGSLAAAVGRRFAGAGDGSAMRWLLAGGVFLGLAVKLPVVPLHTWLPATYSEAPTPVSLLLTGALSKLGVYGLLRILLPLFPGELRELSAPLLVLAVLTIIAPALAAMREHRLKRMLGYSSINHLGYCLLAVAAAAVAGPGPAAQAALAGAVLQMFNHGIIAATLFAVVDRIEDRTGSDDLRVLGGLRSVAPVFAGVSGMAVFASVGLPGLGGFIGEFLVFRGAFAAVPGAAALSLAGLLATAFFLVGMYQRAFAGPVSSAVAGFRDLSGRERWLFAPMVVLMVVPGVAPGLLLELANPWIRAMAGEGVR